jgi:hypothetical protein
MIQLVEFSCFKLLLQRRNATAQFVYDLVKMTDCILEAILEAINPFIQAFISGLTGRLFPYFSRRPGHGPPGGGLIELSARATMAASAVFWTTL